MREKTHLAVMEHNKVVGQKPARDTEKEKCSTSKSSARGSNSWWLRSPTPLSAESYPAGRSPQTGQDHSP
ncbi:hypothetical protein J4Q44_G00364210 [Coregonus suidteri]|uniref:Uncharacterized protein n=1 Tax=Coregonus suidteri TaxID=861788 RepID=A0AAN8KPI3_9TELE